MSGLSLHSFLVANREEVLGRSRSKLVGLPTSAPKASEPADGLALFLDQLITILATQPNARAAELRVVTAGAAIHGADLLRQGLTVAQVVQDYGSICQSVTELASERHAAITSDEFRLFNECLDEAIAEAVTAYEHQRDPSLGGSNMTQLGVLAHEMRNLLATSILSLEALRRGSVGVNGTTGAMLGRSLQGMRALIDRTLAEVRLGADVQTRELVVVSELMEEIEVVGTLQAREQEIHLSVASCARDIFVHGDRPILAAVIANLVQNACKFSTRGGRVSISARATRERVLIEVEDQCGGLPPGKADMMFRPFEKRGLDRSGLGLGLSISLKGARASGGDIQVRDLPGQGCVFTLELPRAQ